jgi:hypothetical protein
MASKLIDDFTQTEALEALFYCRRHLRCMQMYLERDRERNGGIEYSEYKVKEALDWLWNAQERVKAFGIECCDPRFYTTGEAICPSK